MAKSALMIEMIDLLRSRPGITIDQLASSMARSERTIYRWLNELSLDLHMPLYCHDGKYYLMNESDWKKVDLDPQELLALKLSLKSSPFLQASPIRKYAESAWVKIRDAAPCGQIESMSELIGKHSVANTAPVADVKSTVLDVLEDAVSHFKRIRVIYRSQKSNKVKKYTIDPYAIAFRRHSWYLIAYCFEHQKIIQFKLVRLRYVEETDECFCRPDEFSVEDYFRQSWEVWGGGDPIVVKVRFSPKVAAMIAEVKRHSSQVVHPQPDGGIIFEVIVSGIEEIAAWIRGYGRDAEVLEPEHLRDQMLDHAQGMLTIYGCTKKSKIIYSD